MRGTLATRCMFFLGATLLLSLPSLSFADSISPSTYSTTLSVGGSTTLNKTVTVNAGPATTSQIDVFFLADSTGSMGSAIANVKASAASILSTLSSYGSVQFGVGDYKDVGDTYVYRLDSAMTSNAATAQAAINTWTADGGGDGPEAQLYALSQIASSGLTGWRTDSKKIIVWFGDYEGHDPSVGATLTSTISALNAGSIVVDALNVGYGRLNATGQATAITNATGGTLYNGIATSAVADAIKAAIEEETAKYNKVSLGLIGAPAGVTVALSSPYIGTYDRSIDRTFGFDVAFTGTAPGTYNFSIGAYLDGGLVATEYDSITVDSTVPEPSTLLLIGVGLGGFALFRRRRKS